MLKAHNFSSPCHQSSLLKKKSQEKLMLIISVGKTGVNSSVNEKKWACLESFAQNDSIRDLTSVTNDLTRNSI